MLLGIMTTMMMMMPSEIKREAAGKTTTWMTMTAEDTTSMVVTTTTTMTERTTATTRAVRENTTAIHLAVAAPTTGVAKRRRLDISTTVIRPPVGTVAIRRVLLRVAVRDGTAVGMNGITMTVILTRSTTHTQTKLLLLNRTKVALTIPTVATSVEVTIEETITTKAILTRVPLVSGRDRHNNRTMATTHSIIMPQHHMDTAMAAAVEETIGEEKVTLDMIRVGSGHHRIAVEEEGPVVVVVVTDVTTVLITTIENDYEKAVIGGDDE